MDELIRKILGPGADYAREMLTVALILARTMPMMFLTPFLGGKLVPPEIKMGLGVLMTILIFPFAKDALTVGIPITAFAFLLFMLKEVFIGFTIGFINAHMFYVMDMAGRLIDTVRGTSMSEVMDPHSKQRETPIGNMYTQIFVIIFVVIGGHHIFLTAYFLSFKTFPLDKLLSFGGPGFYPFIDFMMQTTGQLMALSVVLAAPVLGATFISDVVFGILNRVAPQLNAYFMSMPVKALGGIIIIFIALEAIFVRFNELVLFALQLVEKVLEMLKMGG